MGFYLDEFRASDTYKVRMRHPKVGEVVGWLRSPPQITTASNWGNIADQRFGGGMTDTAMQYFTGRTMTMGAFSVQKWQGVDKIMITLDLGYVAVNDAFSEVVVPVRELLKFPLPPTFNMDLLEAPVDLSGDKCMIRGKYFVIPGLLPQSTQPQFSHTLSKSGHPVSAQVSVTFETERALSMQDVDGWFK